MRRLVMLFAVVLVLAACTSPQEKIGKEAFSEEKQRGAHVKAVDTVCFQKLAGTANRDTTSISLIIDGDKMGGEFVHYPMEKDSRVGKIEATKNGEHIKGYWTYMQEGISDTLQVEFKIAGDKLIQKNYTIDPKTGREILSDASVFNIEFERIPCKNY